MIGTERVELGWQCNEIYSHSVSCHLSLHVLFPLPIRCYHQQLLRVASARGRGHAKHQIPLSDKTQDSTTPRLRASSYYDSNASV